MLLEVQRVSKRFGGLSALKGVSFQQDAGETLGLIGPNGAGKTTLFSVISGLYRPDTGEVAFDGARITGLESHLICRRGLARTFQIAKPFAGLTVRENVMVGAFNRLRSQREARRKADEVLQLVGLEHRSDAHAGVLTITERKRLEVARALASGPRLLLLDEVMGGLNPTEVTEFGTLLKRLVRDTGLTLLLIEHVMQAIMSLSDRILVLDYGELIAEGKPAEVAANPRVIDAYLGADVNV